MKKTLLFVLIIQAAVFTAKAQIGYNYAQYGLGFGAAYLSGRTDVPGQTSHPALNFNVNYNVTPYFTLSIDYQFGRLSGGFNDYYPKAVKALDPTDANYALLLSLIKPTYLTAVDPAFRSYTNDFQKIALHADLQMGEIFDLSDDQFVTKALKNVYVGAGVGLIYNSIYNNNNRVNADSTYYYGGSDNSQNIVIPLRVGYQFKIYNNYDMPSIFFNIGYEYNYVMGYGLDGYADPTIVSQTFQKYGGFNVGIKFNFGTINSYRKPLH